MVCGGASPSCRRNPLILRRGGSQGRNMDKQYIDQKLIAILYIVTVLIMFLYLSKKRKVDSELNLIFAVYFPVYLLFKKFFRFGKT